MKHLTINGKKLPYVLGMEVIEDYLLDNDMPITDLGAFFKNMTSKTLSELVLRSLEIGCELEGVGFDLTADDIRKSIRKKEISLFSFMAELGTAAENELPEGKQKR